MAKKRYSLIVRGERSTWSFDVLAKPEHVEDWRRDGLIVEEVINTIPVWVADLGLVRAWCFAQDIFFFRNPFRR